MLYPLTEASLLNRIVQLILVVMLSLFVLAGCKDKGDKNVEPTLPPAASVVVPTEAPEPTLAPTPTQSLGTFDSPLSPLPTPQ